MIVTIDGYAGTGKSDAAKLLARRLDFHFLNTGAMYRATGFDLLRAGVDIYAEPRDKARIERHMSGYSFEMPDDRVKLNGEDVTTDIVTEEMGAAASKVGWFLEVRTKLKAEQKRLAAVGNFVCEGRDQGTAVFPGAEVKFFLRAADDVRTERRVKQLLAKRKPAVWATVLQQIRDRDTMDTDRPPELDPLAKAADAVEIDTSHHTLDEVVDQLWQLVQRSRSKASPGD